jgi:hypothetical protein
MILTPGFLTLFRRPGKFCLPVDSYKSPALPNRQSSDAENDFLQAYFRFEI